MIIFIRMYSIISHILQGSLLNELHYVPTCQWVMERSLTSNGGEEFGVIHALYSTVNQSGFMYRLYPQITTNVASWVKTEPQQFAHEKMLGDSGKENLPFDRIYRFRFLLNKLHLALLSPPAPSCTLILPPQLWTPPLPLLTRQTRIWLCEYPIC